MNSIRICQSKFSRRQYGLSMVELLVALTISLFLVAGVIQLFIGSKQTYRSYDALSRIQENGRFALEVMARDIRMAGHYGCLPASATITNTLNTLSTPADYYFQNFGQAQAIQGFESTGAGAWTPAFDEDNIPSPFAGGNVDVITIRSTDGLGAAIQAHGSTTDNPRVPGSDFAACDVVVAANCATAAVFQVTSVTAVAAAVGPPALPAGQTLAHVAGACTPGNSTNNLGTTFNPDTGTEVTQVSTKSYYIRASTDTGRPGLWRRVGAAAAQELVEGVDRMEIRYGVCTGTGAARSVNPPYVDADATGINWANVCSVRIDLLLASLEDNLVTTPQTVVFPADTGINVTATDRRLRQGFSTTVGIRNRLP